MKLKNIAIVLFLNLILLGVAFADDANAPANDSNAPANDLNIVKPAKPTPIKNRGFNMIGLGVVVNSSDNTDFESIRVQLNHTRRLLLNGKLDNNATGRGLLFIGEEKYALKNSAIDEEGDNNKLTAKADIANRDGTVVGSIALTKIKDKANAKLVGIVRGYWNGTITLNGKTYNAYLPSVFSKRIVVLEKIAEKRNEINEKLRNRKK